MAAQWIPSVDSFFNSLVRIVRVVRGHLSTDQVNSAEFWCRRLKEYQRTLRILLARVEESRPDQITFLRDLEILISTMGNLREALNARSLHADFEIDGQNSSPGLSTSVDRTGRMGRPRYIVTETQITMLREEGFRWVDCGMYPRSFSHYFTEKKNRI